MTTEKYQINNEDEEFLNSMSNLIDKKLEQFAVQIEKKYLPL